MTPHFWVPKPTPLYFPERKIERYACMPAPVARRRSIGKGGAGPGTLDTVILAESSLVHFWKLNEAAASGTVADSKGSLTGTVNGATLGSTALGNDGETSASFNGTSNNIKFTSLWGTNANWTYEAVVKQTAFNSTTPFVCGTGNNQSGNAIYVGMGGADSTHIVVQILLNGASLLSGSTLLALNSTHHIAATYDGTNLTLYINGVQDAQTAHAAIAATGTTGTIGAGWNSFSSSANQFYTGNIEKVAFYNQALLQPAMATHFASL